jgi:hypothetical protein
MDPLSITTGCLSLVSFIGTSSLAISSFVKDVRSARQDLDSVKRELVSLEGVVSLISDDCDGKETHIPEALRTQVKNIPKNCSLGVEDIEKVLKEHETAKFGKSVM